MRLAAALLSMAIPLATIASGCSQANTLGGKAPPEVVLPASPTYESGVRALLALKCAYCHTADRTALKPIDAPDDLDLGTYATVQRSDGRVIRGADAIGRWIYDGLLEHPVDSYAGGTIRQMPLDYGTQLTDRERAGLLAWSSEGLPFDASPVFVTGNADLGVPFFGSKGATGKACFDCHGPDAQGTVDGPQIRLVAATPQKVKEMWLVRARHATPLGDADASDLAAFVRSLQGVIP